MNALLISALVLGAAGSAHCIGMCGPIALAVPSPGTSWSARLASTLILNAGRVFTYVLIGAAFGAFGRGAQLIGLQQGVSVAAGIALLATVVLPGLLERWSPAGRLSLLIARLRGNLARNLQRTAPEALFLTGALNGLLPCGLVYGAALGATATGGVLQGALFMALFGMGTWPALIGLRMSGHMVGARTRGLLRRISPAIVTGLAVLMILRGLGLGIPMVSPAPIASAAATSACH